MACINPQHFLLNNDIERFRCPINSGVLSDPIYDECGHAFCKTCFDNRTNQAVCPISKNAIGSKTSKAEDLAEEILELIYSCNVDNSLCSWNGMFKDLPDHKSKDCLIEEVKCTNTDCELKIKRGDLGRHLEVCEFTAKKCQFCTFVGNDIIMEEHHNTDCQEIEIDCDNECIVQHKRKDEQLHKRYACETTKHDCYFRNANCYFTGTWREMGRHASDALVLHGALLEQKLSQFEDYKRLTNQILNELAKNNPNLESPVKESLKQLDALEDNDYSTFKGQFFQQFSNPSLEFIEPTVVKSKEAENQLLFIDRGFHEKHRIVFTLDEYDVELNSRISIGLARKEFLFANKFVAYNESLASEFILISDQSPNAISQNKMHFAAENDYIISYNEHDCEFIVEQLNQKEGSAPSVAKFEFPIEFFEWQPVFIISGPLKITLQDFTDWNQY